MIADPPSDTEGVKATEAPPMPGVATAEAGADGTVEAHAWLSVMPRKWRQRSSWRGQSSSCHRESYSTSWDGSPSIEGFPHERRLTRNTCGSACGREADLRDSAHAMPIPRAWVRRPRIDAP